MEKEQAIKEFAAKHNLTIAEAGLVFGDGTEEDFARNFGFLQEVKTGKVRDADQVRETDLQKQAMDLLNQADEAMKAGDVNKSIRLRRQAFDKKK
jgi:regulator of RNase E activity RraA